MKIALINPNYNGSLESKRTYVPLGLAYLAAMVKKSRHEIKVIDAAAFDLSNEELERELKKSKVDIVGTCAVTSLLEGGLNVCRIAKKLGIKTILGGIHATILPKETICFEEVDIIVIGEGEYTLIELLDSLETKENLENVKGIMFKRFDKKGKIKFIKTKPREKIKDLDKLPFPARELFPLKLYSSYGSLVRKVPSMHMMASRGCPNRCTFCASQNLWGGCVNVRSPKNIVDEIEHLIKNFGAKEIYLYDDTFNLNVKRSEEFCDEIIKRNIKILLRVNARVYPMTKQLLQKMKKAGVWCVLYGVESGNQKVLNDIKKGINLEQVKKAFKMTHEVGIRTLGFFMIGLPKDTSETIQDTLNFAIELNPDFANFTITTIFPGTEIYELAIKEGSIKRINPKEIFKPQLYKHPNFSYKKLEEELSKVYKRFYTRPRYMLRRFLRIRTYTELKSNIIAGLPFLKLKKNPLKVSKKWVPIDRVNEPESP